MHLSSWILPAAYLSPCVVAFYPYRAGEKTGPGPVTKGDDKTARRSSIGEDLVGSGLSPREGTVEVPTLNIRRRPPRDNADSHLNYIRELDYISAKYQARSIPELGTDAASEGAEERLLSTRGTPAKRTNGYTVVTASQPSQSASMAINQDGTDYSYFSTVNFGSSGASLNMLVDTGAANTWVMGADCKSKACLAHNTFGKADSKTLQVTKNPWNVTYGTGQVGGVVVSDTVSMAGFTLPLAFGSASVTSEDFMTYPMDGILGLGRPKSNVMGVPTVMEALDNAHLLKAKLLGVNLQRNVDGATDGAVNFGTVDSSKFTGELSYTRSVSSDGLWEVPVDDAGVDNRGCKFTGKTAIIDTGTSFVLMPPDDAKKLLTQIPNVEPSGETFHIPCATTAAIQFTFSGITYNVSTKDYLGKSVDGGRMCASNIIGRQTFGEDQWLMGDAFLKNVYTVFDFTQNRIGFGVKSTAKPSQTSSSSSSLGQSLFLASSLAQQSTTTPSSTDDAQSSSSPSPLLPGSVGTTTYPASPSGTSTATAAPDTVSISSTSPSRTSGTISTTSPVAALPDTKPSSAQTHLSPSSMLTYLTILLLIYCI